MTIRTRPAPIPEAEVAPKLLLLLLEEEVAGALVSPHNSLDSATILRPLTHADGEAEHSIMLVCLTGVERTDRGTGGPEDPAP